MARIRTIKPEFPQSESMGRVSRESRYCFILLWTIADDSGRLRGNSRMLASLLFPYDPDANKLIPKWLNELAKEKCIIQYQIEGDTYIQICNWLKHQKIDKPSASKIPEFVEGSRILANPRERSCEDQGRDLGSRNGEDQGSSITVVTQTNLFDEIKLVYPKRGGSQKWPEAERAYNARLDEGATHQEMLDGVKRYARYINLTGKINTEYVQQAATFFGRNKGYLDPWTLPSEVKNRQLSAAERVQAEIDKRRGKNDDSVISEQTRSGFGSLEDLMRTVR